MSESNQNPFLSHSLPPRFDKIRVEQLVPAIRHLIQEGESALARLEADISPAFDEAVMRVMDIEEPLGFAWELADHLLAVQNSAELRKAQEAVQSEVVAFTIKAGQSEKIYQALLHLKEGEEWKALDGVQRRLVDKEVLRMKHSGVGLSGSAKERFNAIQKEMAELSTKFMNNVLDSVKEYGLLLKEPSEIAGLPQSLLSGAAASARDKGEKEATSAKGPWLITLDHPVYGPFMQHAERRDLREKLYRTFIARASNGKFDNSNNIEKTLDLRREMAKILGYESYAQISVSSKMADSISAVESLQEELLAASFGHAEKDFDELKSFAKEWVGDPAFELAQWDVAFFAERLREKRFGFGDEDLRPYFQLPKVLDGLFALVHKLFGIRMEPADESVPCWHKDVRFFNVLDENEDVIAGLYMDLYSRPENKRGGAWMGAPYSRRWSSEGPQRIPLAYLVCNQLPPVEGRPSLLTFREVTTLFHELGHALQHMLTTVDLPKIAGTEGVEWDAVELASQFMENWCYDKKTLVGLTQHIHTGESLPDDLYEKILAAKNFRSGSNFLRQLYFGFLDMALHHGFGDNDSEDIASLKARIAQRTHVLMPLPEDRFLCAFMHIFGGGYAAGYYSYKWAEVLSADAFAAFEELGLENDEGITQLGKKYRDTVLALGGSQHPMDVFKAFRGREPSSAALLRHSGLDQSPAQRSKI